MSVGSVVVTRAGSVAKKVWIMPLLMSRWSHLDIMSRPCCPDQMFQALGILSKCRAHMHISVDKIFYSFQSSIFTQSR
jgi:hypothetical protein